MAVISVENLSKQYRLGVVGAGTLREDLIGLWYQLRGKDDPYLNMGEANDRSSQGLSDYVWALRDINFDVQQGEVLGIIGKNGAGKSTLLKLLSRVTAPTTGVIKAKGRIASLLEVGTGFHPELTGRENIYLNGAIMGMKRFEITAKLEEIIEFAGVQRYVDTPVKRYSSGMYVRLAFAVAAHLEPEILIVDEVLAVGDAEFQKKALGKMGEVSSSEGRTVLFVSHNMKAVTTLCTRCLLFEHGMLSTSGLPADVVEAYLRADAAETTMSYLNHEKHFNDGVRLIEARILNDIPIRTTDSVIVSFKVEFQTNVEFHLNMHIKSEDQVHLFQASCQAFEARAGKNYTIQFTIPSNLLNEKTHTVSVSMVKNRSSTFFSVERLIGFKVELDLEKSELQWFGTTPGLLKPLVTSTVE